MIDERISSIMFFWVIKVFSGLVFGQIVYEKRGNVTLASLFAFS